MVDGVNIATGRAFFGRCRQAAIARTMSINRQNYLVDAVAGAFMVNDGAGTELGDGQEAGTGEKIISSSLPPPAGYIRGEGEAGKVITGEEPFTGKVAVTLEVSLICGWGRGEECNVGCGLGP